MRLVYEPKLQNKTISKTKTAVQKVGMGNVSSLLSCSLAVKPVILFLEMWCGPSWKDIRGGQVWFITTLLPMSTSGGKENLSAFMFSSLMTLPHEAGLA